MQATIKTPAGGRNTSSAAAKFETVSSCAGDGEAHHGSITSQKRGVHRPDPVITPRIPSSVTWKRLLCNM
eukprot:1142696-Pelagomonas_calceolata.AAC.7